MCFFCLPDPNYDIHELDIAVNAVATALKDFFKRFPSILTQEQMSEMEEISSKLICWIEELFSLQMFTFSLLFLQ